MKIMHEQIDFPGRSTIKAKWDDFPHFIYPWHFHDEFEIVYVVKSFGLRYVADSIESFGDGDIVLLGSNLPHFWKSDDSFHQGNPALHVQAIVVQFPADFFKEQLPVYPELFSIRKLLERSSKGIHFQPPANKAAGEMLFQILNSSGFGQLITFLEFLQFLSETPHYKLLASEAYRPENHQMTNDRLSKVINFLNFNYQKKLTLEEVADYAGLHPSAFCRFFKEKTGKPVSSFLNELRIGYACKLLIDGHYSVSQICFECGFNNLSNFNRAFRRQTKFSPTEYQQQFHKKNRGITEMVMNH